MRILEPKEGQKYLYFYEDYDLNPSQNISAARKYLREIGCKIGPVWSRMNPPYYLCSCEKGIFELVNDVPAIYIESDDSQVIEHLAKGLIVVCHTYKIGTELRLIDGSSATVIDYINEDYIISDGSKEWQVTENDIQCKKMIPDDIIGKSVRMIITYPDFGDYTDYVGKITNVTKDGNSLRITIMYTFSEELDDFEGYDESDIYEATFLENEIRSIKVLE